MPGVSVTGIGVVAGALAGPSTALEAFLSEGTVPSGGAAGAVDRLVGPDDRRRLTPLCQAAIAAARLALADAGHTGAAAEAAAAGAGLGLVVGTWLGDLRATREFADGYLRRGPAGLSPLLFPSTVMNTMAATTAIAVGATGAALTLNTPDVGGELAIARAAAMIGRGRAAAALAGGVEDLDPFVARALDALGARPDAPATGALFVVLEPTEAARRRGARRLAEITGAAWWATARRRRGAVRSTAVERALAAAHATPASVAHCYGPAPGIDDGRCPRASLAETLGRHAWVGGLHVAAAAWTCRSGVLAGGLPGRMAPGPARGLVRGVARDGTEVALVVEAPAA